MANRESTDIFSIEKRSEVMARVRSKDTKPELIIRSLLHSLGYRFRLHQAGLPGKPDIVLPKYHSAIFVHGCFWHQHPGCKKATLPQNNASFWREKLEGNKERDLAVIDELQHSGWKVLVLWECEIKDLDRVAQRILSFLGE